MDSTQMVTIVGVLIVAMGIAVLKNY